MSLPLPILFLRPLLLCWFLILILAPGSKSLILVLTAQVITSSSGSWCPGSPTISGISCPQLIPDLPLSAPFSHPPPFPQLQHTIELLQTTCPTEVGERNSNYACFSFLPDVCCCVSTDEKTEAHINTLMKASANKGQSWDSSLRSSDPNAHAYTFLYICCLLNIDWKYASEDFNFLHFDSVMMWTTSSEYS